MTVDFVTVEPGNVLQGRTTVSGDKSLSHRVLMFAALANGVSRVQGWLSAGDTQATLRSIQALGVRIDRDADRLVIHGGQLQAPATPLDLANAGTGFRLLAGIMAGQPFASTLDGSAQLRRRPMQRIITPLQMLGANVHAVDGRAPLHFKPSPLRGISYRMPVASAQVKSAVLLAGLFAKGATAVIEPGPTRDHTERMLAAMGADIAIEGDTVVLNPNGALQPVDLVVPGDFSSAAFLIVAALVTPGSNITLTGVNLNPTRTGLLDVLRAMGADLTVAETGSQAGEPVGDIAIRHSVLNGVEVGGATVVRMIDEFPVLMVAALHAEGQTRVRDAAELRVKETDRLAVMTAELRKLGAEISETNDGFSIDGPQPLSGATVAAHDDHRIAMSLLVAGLNTSGPTRVQGAACAADSFPGFPETLARLGAAVATNAVS